MGKLWPFSRKCEVQNDHQLTHVKQRLDDVELRIENLKKRVDVISARRDVNAT